MKPPPLLESRRVSRRHPSSDQWLLKDADLVIGEGSRIALVGPTGAGKTLLLRALARLDSIDGGQILWRGEAVAANAIPSFRQQVIYLHQRPALLEGTVEENFLAPFQLKLHRDREYSRTSILDHLSNVGIGEPFLKQSTNDLSGGEGQVVALLRAIQLEPTVLLLDEPTAALDEKSTQAIEQLVNQWQSQASERAFVWVSHDSSQVDRIASQVVTMNSGSCSSA